MIFQPFPIKPSTFSDNRTLFKIAQNVVIACKSRHSVLFFLENKYWSSGKRLLRLNIVFVLQRLPNETKKPRNLKIPKDAIFP